MLFQHPKIQEILRGQPINNKNAKNSWAILQKCAQFPKFGAKLGKNKMLHFNPFSIKRGTEIEWIDQNTEKKETLMLKIHISNKNPDFIVDSLHLTRICYKKENYKDSFH